MPHIDYCLENGEPIPGVTEILSVLNKPQLMLWANSLGFKRMKYKEVLEQAAELGSIVHDLAEQYSRNNSQLKLVSLKKLDKLNFSDKAIVNRCYKAFKSWCKDYKPKFLFSEVSLISKEHGYGGTFDMICDINGEKVLVDIKTSSSIYETMFVQLRAYTMLIEENKLCDLDGVAILLLSKKSNKYEYVYFDMRENLFKNHAKDTFLALMDAYYHTEWFKTYMRSEIDNRRKGLYRDKIQKKKMDDVKFRNTMEGIF